MKKLYPVILLFGVIQVHVVHSQVIRSFSHRYYNPSVRGNVVYVSNSIITTTGIGSGNPGTGEAPPGGTSRNNNGAAANINVDAVTIIPFGSSWKYWANTQANYQANWQTVAYNDAAWPSGNAELGYGDGDEATCIPSGGGGTLCIPTGNKWLTAYFRKTVNIANPTLYTNFTINVERDDGCVVYVNGVEIGRSNMNAGAVTWATLAPSAIEDGLASFIIPSTAFVAGNNVIAVEVHQAAASSSDLSFNLELLTSAQTNSSTADLNLPSCATVLWAGLYWGAGQGTDGTTTGWITGETTCKLKIPGAGSYINITSTTTDYHNSTLAPGLVHTGYKCFTDITSLINTASPNGTYTIADMVVPVGINNGYGGWTIVVAYQNPSDIIRELNVYDGNVIIDQGQPAVDIALSGFLTPPSGPVNCELGAVVFDGDRSSLDSFSFRQNGAPAFLNLTPNATSNLNDMWNSTISYKGVVVATRNPSFQNTLGYDADIIDLPNVGNINLGNNQTSATIRLSSPNENYVVQVVTATISIKEPYMQLTNTATDVNGGSLTGGDELSFDLAYTNNGNDSTLNTYIIDTIPRGSSYKPNSLQIGGVPKTDAAGDDEAEYDAIGNRVIFRVGTAASSNNGGRVLSGGSGTVRFSVLASNICFAVSCSNTITNQATIYYTGATSGNNFSSRGGFISSGCFAENPSSNVVSGSCVSARDTILANICPVTTVTLPYANYLGYRFYSAMPFVMANVYDHFIPVTSTRVIYAFYDGPGICDDTLQLNIFITTCPDIDDDNDGLPDYVEINITTALADHDSDGMLNWNDPQYPGFIDLNSDGFNDNFDPSADSDNDNVPNFTDPSFAGYVDANGDGVNDNMDKDLDGIPNHLDLDSDNDGIPDTAESFGVDANGDGRIDNYSDTDNDGFSQNVDANNTGVNNSGAGLGPLDTDGDSIPNYLDLDSDDDGIPDITEAFGTDAGNSARVSSYADTDGDGYTDGLDADVGNDNISENSAVALLRTGSDGNNDGRCDSWPNKNMDSDARPNPYDLDSDGDGITDVKEAQFTDADWNGRVDGLVNTDGRNTVLAAAGALTIPDTDGSGWANPFDIDADDDGIPDNVEGLTTLGYLLPSGVDTDSDGIDNMYDNYAGFGGDGIHMVDTDSDTQPDYLDGDTDNDGAIDRIEGNDLNLNGFPDDNVTLTGSDTDSDGLDDRFDANNSSVEATSAYMGNGGTTLGDATPGSITTVQHTPIAYGCPLERDWRCIPYILDCSITQFTALLQGRNVRLDWTIFCKKEVSHFIIERSADAVNFHQVEMVAGRPVVHESEAYYITDNVASVSGNITYYRMKTILKDGQVTISNIVTVKLNKLEENDVQILPNPVKKQLQLCVNTHTSAQAIIYIIDGNGKMVQRFMASLQAGSNMLLYPETGKLPAGIYYLHMNMGDISIKRKFSKID